MRVSSKLIIVACVLLVAAAVLSFLMFTEQLRPSFWLNSVAFVCATAGLILGFIGIAEHMRSRR